MIEKIETGEFKTPFMKFGDRVRIEMLGADGRDIFGAIEQEVRRYATATTGDDESEADRNLMKQ